MPVPDRSTADSLARPRVLLLGDPAARPDGLERALVRGGFQVTESARIPPGRPAGPLPDLLLITCAAADERLETEMRALDPDFWGAIPVMVVLAAGDPEAPFRALRLGVSDVMVAPVHLGELCARVDARLRGRIDAEALRQEQQVNALSFDIFAEVSSAIRPDEIIQTLVRRVGQALQLSHCSFILTRPSEEVGRVVAVHESPRLRDLTVDLKRYPEVQAALRLGRAVYVPDVYTDPMFEETRARWTELQLKVDVRSVLAIPVPMQAGTSGVFLIRTRRSDAELTPRQVAFAETLTGAAARLLESEERRTSLYRRQASAPTRDPLTGCGTLDALDQRIREEFERARRYALSFSLILLDVDQLRTINERLGTAGGDLVLSTLGGLLLRELRAPDFVSRYGGDEFALILPETDLEGARRSIARVRERILSGGFGEIQPQDRPRLSAGIVTFPHPSAVQTEDLFALVEAALLRGKAQTEDRIGTAESVAA